MKKLLLTSEGINSFPETREEKLNHLIKILERDSVRENFNMDCWFEGDLEKLECGFAACALGNAALDPIFQEMGLYIKKHEYGLSFLVGYKSREESYEAAAEFFGLNYSECYFLFNPEEYFLFPESYKINFVRDVLLALDHDEKHAIENYYFVYSDYRGTEDTNVPPEMVIKHIELVRDNPTMFEFI